MWEVVRIETCVEPVVIETRGLHLISQLLDDPVQGIDSRIHFVFDELRVLFQQIARAHQIFHKSIHALVFLDIDLA
jgi:hypothetical protein